MTRLSSCTVKLDAADPLMKLLLVWW